MVCEYRRVSNGSLLKESVENCGTLFEVNLFNGNRDYYYVYEDRRSQVLMNF